MTTPGDVRSFAHTETQSGPSIRGTGGSNPPPAASHGETRYLRMDKNSEVSKPWKPNS